MSMRTIGYTKGAYRADAGVVATDDGRFQGTVAFSRGEAGAEAERHFVPVASDSQEEALDEAKALAHRLLSAVH